MAGQHLTVGPSEQEAAADEMSNSTLHQEFDNCLSSILGRNILLSWFTMYLLFLPVFLFVLYLGFNKWMTSQSSASGGLSHSDVFTINMVAMDIISVAALCVLTYGLLRMDKSAASFGGDTILGTMTGQALFHSLTCVERYLAVVHPVTYMRLKREGGVTIRNISITFVWAISLIYFLIYFFLKNETFYALSILILSFALLPLVTYCSVYVLCVLIRPKPGDGVKLKKQIDQSKRSTVYTMVAILGALLLRLVANIMYTSVHFSLAHVDGCVSTIASMWMALPSSLVLPLLFLHRAGKLNICK